MSDFDRRHQDLALDEALIQSFPASDPVAINCSYVAHVYSPPRPHLWAWHEVAFHKRSRRTLSLLGTIRRRQY